MRLRHTFAALGPALLSVTARACTVCDSLTGHQLRAGLFNGHFLQTCGLVAAPVPVFIAAILLLHRAMPDLPENPGKPSEAPQFANSLTAAEPAL